MTDEKNKVKYDLEEDESVVYSKTVDSPKEKIEFRSMIVPEKIIE